MSISKPRPSSAQSGSKRNHSSETGLNGTPKAVNGAYVNGHAPATPPVGGNLAERFKELVRMAQDQGNLTHGDVEELLADLRLPPEAMAEVYSKLRALEIEIVDAA